MIGPASVILSILLVLPAAAQVSPAPAATTAPGELFDLHPKRSIKAFAKEEYRIWTSPFRRSSYDSHSVKKYVIPFAIIAAGLIASDLRTADALPNTVDQAIWSGRVSQMGASHTVVGFSGATFLFGQLAKNDHARETGLLALEAVAHTQVVVFGVKQITNRRRPPETQQHRGFWKGGNSFPSGHAATAFSVAAVFAYEYRDRIAVPIVAYTLASAIAASRTSARRHWFSDIFVGGSTGFLLGRYVYKRHHDNRLPGSPVIRTRLTPDVGISSGGVALSWHW